MANFLSLSTIKERFLRFARLAKDPLCQKSRGGSEYCLEFGAWDLFGIWDLEIGIYSTLALPKLSCHDHYLQNPWL